MKLKTKWLMLFSPRKHFAIIVFMIVLSMTSCKRTIESVNTNTSPGVESAKEWWYGVFRKSQAYNQLDKASILAPSPDKPTKKYPNWQRAVSYAIGKLEIVELPLAYQTNSILLPRMQYLFNTAEGVRVANSAIHRLMLIKAHGITNVRTVTIVPSPEYAKKYNYDISHIRLSKLPSDFSGFLMIGGWDESVKNIVRISGGQLNEKIKIYSTEEMTKHEVPSLNTSVQVCGVEWVPKWVLVCAVVPTGDVVDDQRRCEEQGTWVDQGGWENVCYDVEDDDNGDPCAGLTYEECICQVYGLDCDGDDDGGGDGSDECNQEAIDEVVQEFNEYAKIKSPATVSHYADASIDGGDSIVGDFTWTVVEGEFANWQIRARTEFKYYNTKYFNINLMRYENIFDLFYFKTGNGYYVGSNSFITSTYTTIAPTTNNVINNNTTNPIGISRVRGTIEHVSNVKIKLPICGDIALRRTDEVDNSCNFHPR